jgi:hypothetical protein
MAMHYFHLSNGHTTLDHDGADHPDLNSIRKEALRVLRELLNLGPTDGLWGGGRLEGLGHGSAWFNRADRP